MWGDPLLTQRDFVAYSCVKARRTIELPFALVSGVGPCIGLLDAGPHPQGEGEVLRFFSGPLV